MARRASHKAGSGVTAFQQRVYDAVRGIPRGRVATYAAVARCIGCASTRAVGQALRRNPFAPDVPCHRVIASTLRPGGFQGHFHGEPVARKIRMLAREGVAFRRGRLADRSKVYQF